MKLVTIYIRIKRIIFANGGVDLLQIISECTDSVPAKTLGSQEGWSEILHRWKRGTKHVIFVRGGLEWLQMR